MCEMKWRERKGEGGEGEGQTCVEKKKVVSEGQRRGGGVQEDKQTYKHVHTLLVTH